MVTYRRNLAPGASYFFTVTLHDRSSSLLVEQIPLLREAIHTVKKKHPFTIDAIVILPDHIHCIWTLPPDDANYSLRWREIKSQFSRQIPKDEYRTVSRKNKAERGIWQRRFWEHTLRDDSDIEKHTDYIYYNPVKHGYVKYVADWPYSSFNRSVKREEYPKDWGGEERDGNGCFGE